MNIFITKLNFKTQENELRRVFEEFGEVSSVKIIIDKLTGRPKGFGFVEMPNDNEAIEAINALNETEVDGRVIVVKKAEPRENNNSSFNRGGGNFQRNNRY